jgi:acetolactate synthase-1/2/3 large subunit
LKGKTAIAKILKEEGVEFVTGFPYNPLFDAMAEEGIRPIKTRTERVAVNIADGFTRASFGKRHGVCIMQWSAGVENAFAGVAHAFADSVPILALPGGNERRRMVAPNFSAKQNYREITKWVDMVNFADRAPEMMRLAFSYLRHGRPGPVMLEVPRDVMEEDIEDTAFHYRHVSSHRSAGDPADIREVAQALIKANCPIIRAGQGILYAEAWDELRELAEWLQMPVYTTMNGKSAFPENHPLSLGTGGRSRPRTVLYFHDKADLIFAIGSSCTIEPFTTPIPKSKPVIQSAIDERDINKDYSVAQAIIGDAKLVLNQLLEEVKKLVPKREKSAVIGEIKKVKDEWMKEWLPRLTSDETPINPYRVIQDIMQAFDEKETIITHDSGTPRDHMLPFYQANTPGSYIGWGKSTTLGQGLGLAMGAKLARPEKTCINLMGDGAFGMVGMDFETAVREQIPIITILLNNSILGGYGKLQPVAIEHFSFNTVSGDYRKIAEALGGYTERVEKPKDIIPALQRAKEANDTGKAALIEIMDREEPAFSQ